MQNLLEQCVFHLWYVFFSNQNITFFASSLFERPTYFFAFIRIAVIFAASITLRPWLANLIDWLIQLVYEFWLVLSNKHKLPEMLLTAYQL